VSGKRAEIPVEGRREERGDGPVGDLECTVCESVSLTPNLYDERTKGADKFSANTNDTTS
jgi:hypothetical protein